jgi:hypothetical protein
VEQLKNPEKKRKTTFLLREAKPTTIERSSFQPQDHLGAKGNKNQKKTTSHREASQNCFSCKIQKTPSFQFSSIALGAVTQPTRWAD